MNSIIKQVLEKIEREHNVTILYACESGSRAWGFASKDSDYDVRFIYIHERDWYLGIDDQRDVIELPVNEVLDINGWDLRKTLRLFRKSNSPLYEWLQSPVIYMKNDQFYEEITALSRDYFLLRAGYHHYLNMAKNCFDNDLQGRVIKIKKYFYALRSVLACQWILNKRELPPMEFSVLRKLIHEELQSEIDILLELKEKGDEKLFTPIIPSIHQFLVEAIQFCVDRGMDLPEEQNHTEQLNSLFRTLLKKIGTMIFENLIENKTVVLLECISGSRAYGLALPHSDMDIKGVFLLPKDAFFSLEYTEQLSNASNDIVYYELKRFIDLLSKNNPNILELLATPDDCILVKHALMKDVQTELFLSRQCKQTFAGYAQAQIKKARGLNKRISKPMCKERKSILNFCYVIQGQGAVSLNQWLQINAFHQEDCGLTNIPHIKDVYSIFHNSQNKDGKFKGIFSGNVRAVFSDRKLSDLTSGLPTNFRPDLLSTNNYYLFGMLMPGRNSNAPNYRCGFNGKEKDDEVTCSAGVTYDYPAGADVR